MTSSSTLTIQAILLPFVTLLVVLTGLFVITAITICPSLIAIVIIIILWITDTKQRHPYSINTSIDTTNNNEQIVEVQQQLVLVSFILYRTAYITTIVVIQIIHIRYLWVDRYYLHFFRWLLLPIRRAIVPLVMFVARIESIREATPTLYCKVNWNNSNPNTISDNNGGIESTINLKKLNNTTSSQPTDGNERTINIVLQQMKKTVRRHYRRMELFYQRDDIYHIACRCEDSLQLQEMIPILWDHQKRTCQRTKKNVIEEFIKRFLVVTLIPDGILDLYYSKPDNTTTKTNELVAFQLSIQQGTVLHWFMYFAKESVSKSGIWFHGSLLAIVRASKSDNTIHYVNAQCHQTETKQHAGFSVAEHTDNSVLPILYPWNFTQTIPESIMNIPLWKHPR